MRISKAATEFPHLEKIVGDRDGGSGASTTPSWPSPSRATSLPYPSTTPEIPVFAARTSGKPSSTARMRALAKC